MKDDFKLPWEKELNNELAEIENSSNSVEGVNKDGKKLRTSIGEYAAKKNRQWSYVTRHNNSGDDLTKPELGPEPGPE